MATFPLRKGSQGPEVTLLAQVAALRFASYAREFDGSPLKADGYFGLGEEAFVRNWQARSKLPATGQLPEDQYRAIVGQGAPSTGGGTVIPARRKIWFYSAPGSGGNWDQGPSFDLGNRCADVLKLNHQPMSFQKGGYLGFMGGDPTFSYVDVTHDQYKSLEYLLDHNPDINSPDLELWFSGYSQSADGMEDALEILFGDGGFVIPKTGETAGPGKYRHLRSRINGVVQFGNPSTKGTGIARKVRPDWLYALVRNVNYDNDFYAVVPKSDKIRPPMYAIIIEAEMELPFFVHVLRLAVPIISKWATVALPFVAPLLGGFGPLVQMGLGLLPQLTGLASSPLLGNMLGQAGSDADTKVDEDIIALLEPTGVLSNIPGIIGLIGALPGLQAHGGYPFDPAMMDRAFAHVAGFRR